MKGILKIYHPEETLVYHIHSSYCKALYSNGENYLELEVITNEDLDHVEDDSLQYHYPQIALKVSEFPILTNVLEKNTFFINNSEEDIYTEIDVFDDQEVNVYQNELSFTNNENDGLELLWNGKIDDFYAESSNPIPFKLKCHFKEEEINIED